MKLNAAVATALLPSIAFGFPQFIGAENKEHVLRMLKERQDAEAGIKSKRSVVSSLTGSISSLLSTVVSDVDGLLGSVATGVLNPDDKRPSAGYTFQAPGAGDSRGPCPGLNLLANYGYLPRNGYVTFGEILTATADGFNMAADLAAVLGVFSILAAGDIATESFYLGSGPGDVGGLNRHSTSEADVSPNREDFYLGCGDNHHVSSRLFAQNVALAKAGSGLFDMDVMGDQYALNAAFSKTNNPYLYYFPFPQIVSLGAFAFYPQFFSNGTYGAGGVPNYESVSSIIGAQLDTTTGQFEYVPEQWPTNWYRRATPYGAVDALADGFLQIYPNNVIVPGVGQLGTGNLNVTTLLCDMYQGINSITPLLVAGTEEEVAAAASWALSTLDPYFGLTALGCPSSVLSPDTVSGDGIFPSASATGGPINSPSAQAVWEGNNTYSKTYFTAAPTAPLCSH